MKLNAKVLAVIMLVMCVTTLKSIAAPTVVDSCKIESALPIVYIIEDIDIETRKSNYHLEILPYIDLNRIQYIFGYELLPGVVISSSIGPINMLGWKWDMKKLPLNNKIGSVPSLEFLKENWNNEVINKIIKMDNFIMETTKNEETKKFFHLGVCLCLDASSTPYLFLLSTGVDMKYDAGEDVRGHLRMLITF